MSLIYLSCAWIAGVFLGSYLRIPLFLILTGLIPLPLIFIIRQYRKPVILTSLSLIIFFSGAIYYQSRLPLDNENSLRFYNDRGIVEIKGLVAGAPESGDSSLRVRFSAQEINWQGEWRKISGTALLFVPGYQSYHYGDVLQVTGKLETPPELDDFSYRDYLARQGIYSTMLYPKVELLETGKGSKPLLWIYSLRDRLSRTLAEVLPEPQASLAQGIILGIRDNIPPSIKASFVHTGTAHILAISGQNLSILTGILLGLGIWIFGKRGYVYIWLALVTIWLYALLTGMQPPVLRATIMASVFLVAELLGRQRSAITALALAAAIMVGVSPQVLWDAAFQMSFMAMVGLIFIFPYLQPLGRKVANAIAGEEGRLASVANFFADSFSVTLGATITVWPLIAYYFGIISPVAPLATFFALPALPLVIVTGILTGGLGLIALPVAWVVSWLTWLFLSYMLIVVKTFDAIPFIRVGSVNVKVILVYYVALILAGGLYNKKTEMRKSVIRLADWLKLAIGKLSMKWALPALLVMAIMVWVVAITLPDDNLRVSFLDVGQGDAILIQKGSQQILVDGGPSPQLVSIELGKQMPFWDRTIDLVVLTHPHADHLTGLVEVLKRYKVSQVLYTDLDSVKYDTPQYDEWLSLIRTKNIEDIPAQAGQQIRMGEVKMEVLNPPQSLLKDTQSDIDNSGVVLRLSTGKVSFLLTADIMQETEFELLAQRADLPSTVLQVAHHGSNTSTTVEFLEVVNPRMVVISVGEANRFGHPNVVVMDRLRDKLGQDNIYRTDKHGTIEFITDGERLWMKAGK